MAISNGQVIINRTRIEMKQNRIGMHARPMALEILLLKSYRSAVSSHWPATNCTEAAFQLDTTVQQEHFN